MLTLLVAFTLFPGTALTYSALPDQAQFVAWVQELRQEAQPPEPQFRFQIKTSQSKEVRTGSQTQSVARSKQIRPVDPQVFKPAAGRINIAVEVKESHIQQREDTQHRVISGGESVFNNISIE